jgi:hypothetical protein
MIDGAGVGSMPAGLLRKGPGKNHTFVLLEATSYHSANTCVLAKWELVTSIKGMTHIQTPQWFKPPYSHITADATTHIAFRGFLNVEAPEQDPQPIHDQ